MGDVRFVPGSFRIPSTARTGDRVVCETEIDNTNDLDYEDFEIVWSLYSDSQGNDLIGEKSYQDDLWGWPGQVGGHTSKFKFTMPKTDVWIMVELFRLHNGSRTKSDSTGLVNIDNPEVPNDKNGGGWWNRKMLGLPVYAYIAVGTGAVIGGVVAE